MKKSTILAIIFLTVASISNAAPVGHKLMDCNIPEGDYQQVMVYQKNSTLMLARLSNNGNWIESELPLQQWRKQKILIPCLESQRTCGVIARTSEGWAYKIGDTSYLIQGLCL